MIKFITEEYLRDIYKKQPFETFALNKGQRLTPGASQFLSDRRIAIAEEARIVNDEKCSKNTDTEKLECSFNKTEAVLQNSVCLSQYQKIKVMYKLKTLQSKFLVVGNEILSTDITLAKGILSLERKLSVIVNSICNNATFDDINVVECLVISKENFYKNMDDCFEITEKHLILDNANEILKINQLKCELRELLISIEKLNECISSELKIKIIRNINSIINLLSQLICSAIGGCTCQKNI
ncbi:cobalamin adenosyltransferase [Sedimentibacter sp. zth1]|uniref:cobalamin adenosyltransferase n=1 Tax=Sedimentibacter sp. zth1 TaxID=2816908 RepID=UPI001A92E9D6|nr:cobalamin adenosyltransferase [Sedimentibacter sp. zth1]QSX05619.1 cobalamin adenosyltransferase [Sedimentibacter sp. zth1]